ncbi:unnamed protein product [Trichobilharzia regenti]|nr:unnamed protein product [Trichobilharzia regenti]
MMEIILSQLHGLLVNVSVSLGIYEMKPAFI